jgi:ribosomal protein L31E
MDGKSFIRSLAKCHPTQVVPLLRSGNESQWEAIKQLCDGAAGGSIDMKGIKLPRTTRRWFKNVVNGRHSNINSLKRATIQRGGSKAELIGTTIKTLAKVAAPHLKKAGVHLGKKLAATVISRGIEKVGSKLKSTPTEPVTSKEEDEEIDNILREYGETESEQKKAAT